MSWEGKRIGRKGQGGGRVREEDMCEGGRDRDGRRKGGRWDGDGERAELRRGIITDRIL